MSEDQSSFMRGTFVAFAVGALLGAGVALLYAPRSGKELRGMIADKGRALKGKAQHTLEEAKGYIDNKKAEIGVAYDSAREAMREERSKHLKSV